MESVSTFFLYVRTGIKSTRPEAPRLTTYNISTPLKTLSTFNNSSMMDGTPSEISLDDGVSLVKATRSITDHEPTHTTLYFVY